MYINKIDDLINDTIDDFFITISMNKDLFAKIYKESNFIKYQKEINAIFIKFISEIKTDSLKEFVKSVDALNRITDTLKRYIVIYLFLTIGFYYTGREDTFINNIVEFTKNQIGYDFKISDFFNSESNALIIKYFLLVKNVQVLLTADKAKISVIRHKPDVKQAIDFLNELGNELVTKNFILENVSDVQTQANNIIKTLIIENIYRVHEKKEFFKLLEITENIEGEYIYIDVVYPVKKVMDYRNIESLLSKREISSGFGYLLWDFISTYETNKSLSELKLDDKITELIDSRIIVPICDDFLLYHKNTEKYDMKDIQKIKTKDDTKLKYIVNKIERTTEFYSELASKDSKIKQEIKSLFYVPLYNRKAITINNFEDINIINKYLNQGIKFSDNVDYYNKLLHYRKYPFVNFANFENMGFSFALNKTVPIVRSVSFANGDFKQNKNSLLQLRIGSKDMTVNIVGFLIHTNRRNIHCSKIKDILNIKQIDPSLKSDGFKLMKKYLRQTDILQKKFNSSVYWLFDSDDMNQIKYNFSKIYDNILNDLYYIILSKYEANKKLTLDMGYKILNYYENRTLNIPIYSQTYLDIETKLYELVEKTTDQYDKQDDIIKGLDEHSLKLPTYKFKSDPNVSLTVINVNKLQTNVKTSTDSNTDSNTDSDFDFDTSQIQIQIPTNPTTMGLALCQHNLTWDNLTKMQISNPKKYLEEFHIFMKKYIYENSDFEYICKSCEHQLNMKKYISAVISNDNDSFFIYDSPFEIPLEEVPEYEKYKNTIRSVDKIIEKIGNITNLQYFVGSTPTSKSKRKTLVRETIDLLLLSNKELRNTMKERNIKIYGINRDLSRLFSFELDNSIFVFSTKDKDKYKPIKQNNIKSYIIILMLLEMNESQLFLLTNDKKSNCNFAFFEKVYVGLFSDLKIIINNTGDLGQLTKYPVLCYIIYMISCTMVKYNMWEYEYPEQTKKQKFLPVIQKEIIHTVIDLLNSVLETSIMPKKNYLYEIISTKFFRLLNTLCDTRGDMYIRLTNNKTLANSGEKKNYALVTRKPTLLTGKLTEPVYEIAQRILCRPPKIIFYKKPNDFRFINKYNRITNITNCSNGKFHEYVTKGDNFVCGVCKKSITDKYDEALSNKISHEYKYIRLQNIASIRCIKDGKFHMFSQTQKSSNPQTSCVKCSNPKTHIYTNKELDAINEQLQSPVEKTNPAQTSTSSYDEKLLKKLSSEYKPDYLDKFIDLLETSIGGSDSSKQSHLRMNTYLIDHDHLGYTLDKPIILTDADNKILTKTNHPFYKTDVLYYSSYKNGKTDVYYDVITKILLGYKEESKNYVLNKKTDKFLKITYSIHDKLKFLGFPDHYMNIQEKYDQLVNDPDITTDHALINNLIIQDIMRTRLINLKKTLYEFQRLFYRIMNNYTSPSDTTLYDNSFFANKYNKIFTTHKKKISKISTFDEKGQHQILKHWKGIYSGVNIQPFDITTINVDFQTYKILNISLLTSNPELALFYIIGEFTKLLTYNKNNFIKIDISNFIIEFINNMDETFNTEKMHNNLELKKFNYISKSMFYLDNTSQSISVDSTQGIYEEYVDKSDKIDIEQVKLKANEDYDAEEANNSLDIDNNYDSGDEMYLDEDPGLDYHD